MLKGIGEGIDTALSIILWTVIILFICSLFT